MSKPEISTALRRFEVPAAHLDRAGLELLIGAGEGHFHDADAATRFLLEKADDITVDVVRRRADAIRHQGEVEKLRAQAVGCRLLLGGGDSGPGRETANDQERSEQGTEA